MTEDEIMARRTKNGGWTRETLAEWGVPWPPPKGWKLMAGANRFQRHGDGREPGSGGF